MTKWFCDICGKELNECNVEHYKVKKIDRECWETFWLKLDVHKECWEELCKLVKEKVEKNDGN